MKRQTVRYSWYRSTCNCIDCYAHRMGVYKDLGHRIMHDIWEENKAKLKQRISRQYTSVIDQIKAAREKQEPEPLPF